jgi:hypothetical protein
MAAPVLSFTNPVKGVALARPWILSITATLVATAYATATGGVTLDFTIPLATAIQDPLDWTDILEIFGNTADGYTCVLTRTATLNQYTCRLYTSGASEIADGNITKTLLLRMMLAGGGKA